MYRLPKCKCFEKPTILTDSGYYTTVKAIYQTIKQYEEMEKAFYDMADNTIDINLANEYRSLADRCDLIAYKYNELFNDCLYKNVVSDMYEEMLDTHRREKRFMISAIFAYYGKETKEKNQEV